MTKLRAQLPLVVAVAAALAAVGGPAVTAGAAVRHAASRTPRSHRCPGGPVSG